MHSGFKREQLPVAVGDFDAVSVDYGHIAHSGSGDEFGGERPHSANADHEDIFAAQPPDFLFSQQQLTALEYPLSVHW